MENDSIDGVAYRVEWSNGERFIEPGHDKVESSHTMLGRVLYFTKRSVYQVGSGTETAGEASGSAGRSAALSSCPTCGYPFANSDDPVIVTMTHSELQTYTTNLLREIQTLRR